MSRFIRLLLLMLLPALAWGAPDAPVVLVFGDSLAAGYGLPQSQSWAYLLGKQLAPRYRVVNASVSGETSSGGLTRIESALEQHRPAIVMIELGANDGLRGLPLADTKRNLAAIIGKAKQAKARVLLIGMQLPPNFGAAYARRFSTLYSELASENKVPLLPFLLEGFADKRELFQADMLHPTAQAQPMIVDTVTKALEPLLKP